MLLHVAHAASDPANMTPLTLEPLSTFAPSL